MDGGSKKGEAGGRGVENGGEEGAKKGVAPDLLRISYGFASEKSVESSVEIISNFNFIYELAAS